MGIEFHDLCDTGAVLYQLNYQANWGLVTYCELVIHVYPKKVIMQISQLLKLCA